MLVWKDFASLRFADYDRIVLTPILQDVYQHQQYNDDDYDDE